MYKYKKISFAIISFLLAFSMMAQENDSYIKGSVKNSNGEYLEFARVYLKKTAMGTSTDDKGQFSLYAKPGNYTLSVNYIGYETFEKQIQLKPHDDVSIVITLKSKQQNLDEVTVVAKSPIQQLKESAYNVVTIDTKSLQNTTKNLGDALAQIPSIKIRESGGVGSDLQLMMDGFSGNHIKIFIDGVPQEGVGSSFGLNNIPVNYAERIEVYKGVVPVGFGTDAIGGVINIVTKKNIQQWFVDASYSYGSFNTHKSYVNFGQTFRSGFTYNINAFQNYSDNNYHVDTPVKEFIGDNSSSIDNDKIEHVKRFHDTYHNEAIVAKAGFVNKKWADRFLVGFTYSHMHKDIQTGVKQAIVFGEKYRKGYSIMPSLEYHKNSFFTEGLSINVTANYNKNITQNVDTSTFEYNWRGEKRPMSLPGEQTYQHIRSDNENWNATLTANYQLGEDHQFIFNHVFNNFDRSNKSLLNDNTSEDAISKETRKNISGLSYLYMPSQKWNISVFGKYYNQFTAGPIATTSAQDNFTRTTHSVSATGYGIAATYFILHDLQVKASFEKAYRLPTNEEMFGDEDLEIGSIKIKPENSKNFNFNLSYNKGFGKHSIYAEGGLIFRRTKDYIQRKIESLGGGKYGAAYENHGKVKTNGYNFSLRYVFSDWVNIGANFTQLNAYDNVKTVSADSKQESLTYGARMPNIPYSFVNSDINFYWNNLWKKGNQLVVTYDNLYMHNFPLYSEALGSESKFVVPSQFSHNLTISYAILKGRYNFSFECKNFTNEKLYDNFSLQRAGRAFYGKVRVYFGN